MQINNPNSVTQSGSSLESIIEQLNNRIYTLEQALTAIGYDSKAAKKRRFPSKRQSVILSSLTRALCVETIDPLKQNRVRYFHPLLHDPKATVFSLPFAEQNSAMGGFDDCGLSWVPPAGSTLLVGFEGGSVDSCFYLGTFWHRNRGPNGIDLTQVYPSREYQAIHQGHRKGYLVGPNDESQVLPPWNTESYNGRDIDQVAEFVNDPLEQERTTFPNIYGFKTPEKHMLKKVDGDAKCNRRHKRMEILSSCGNWMIFKDDHMHRGGAWAHPSCSGGTHVDACSSNITQEDQFFSTDILGKPLEKAECNGESQSFVLGGHSSTPCDPDTKHCNSNTAANQYFKHENECRPYKGPRTPQNNKCDLPQSGIQFLSISGHSLGMDDSVEEPRGIPNWERSLEPFDFGCNNKFLGRTFWISATGHSIMMSDIEEKSNLRGDKNFIRLRSAAGNRIELNDHTIGEGECISCPPNYAGNQRGIHLQSTSNHVIKMIDHMNLQCSPCRKEGGIPTSKATQAYIQIRSGYGLEMRFNDDNSQEQTQNQWIQITNPQCVDATTDDNCNSCESKECRGPHFFRMQARPKGQPGIVFLRAGGHAIRQTYDMDIVLVGDKEKNPSDKFTYVSKQRVSVTEDVDYRHSGKMHIFFAEKQILLMAGRDCPPAPGKKCKGPCVYNVIVARCPVFCPVTGILHWTEKAMSERVFASGYHPCQVPCGGGGCEEYEEQMANAQDQPCVEDPEESE